MWRVKNAVYIEFPSPVRSLGSRWRQHASPPPYSDWSRASRRKTHSATAMANEAEEVERCSIVAGIPETRRRLRVPEREGEEEPVFLLWQSGALLQALQQSAAGREVSAVALHRLACLVHDAHRKIATYFDSTADSLRLAAVALGCVLPCDDLVLL